MGVKVRVTYRERLVLDCILKERMTYKATAKRLGCTANNIGATLSRIRKRYPHILPTNYIKRFVPYEIPDKYVNKVYLANLNNNEEEEAMS